MSHADTPTILSAQDLLLGSQAIHEIEILPEILMPGRTTPELDGPLAVRVRPLSMATLTLISKAAWDDPSLVPLLTIKEALVEPVLSLDQVRQMHVGLVHYLVSQINLVSGLTADGEALDAAAQTPTGRAQLLLAKHFGWTPEQVSRLTPGQVAVYLAGIEQLLQLEEARQ